MKLTKTRLDHATLETVWEKSKTSIIELGNQNQNVISRTEIVIDYYN